MLHVTKEVGFYASVLMKAGPQTLSKKWVVTSSCSLKYDLQHLSTTRINWYCTVERIIM